MRTLRILLLATFALGCATEVTPTDAATTGDDGGHGEDAGRDASLPDSGETCDVDGDGHAAPSCGGDDCDDADPNRFPGHSETCDDHDEDCNDATFGTSDADGDGHVDATCCNGIGAAAQCGDDCDDALVGVHPGTTETCNGIDDDCDAAIDEGVQVPFYSDCDGDGFGGGAAMLLCTPSSCMGNAAVTDHLDCDDADRNAHPGVAESCNGTDDDCNGTVDDAAAADAWCASRVPHATATTCSSSTCVATACEPSHHICAGACVPSTEIASCGTRCTPCAPPAHASATCDGTSCGFVCDAGWASSGAGCDLIAPRPISPSSTSTVTSRRPTLRWELATGTDGARVELCADRACTLVIETVDAVGTSARPSADLPPGVAFWRLRGRSGAVTSAIAGPTWQLVVGARSAPLDVSWGTTLDLNGDGYADLAVGAPGAESQGGRVYVHLGGPMGIAATASRVLDSPGGANTGFGVAVASAGDVNGDGYADLAVGASREPSTERVFLFFGGPSGIGTTPSAFLAAPTGNSLFGESVASAGDVDRDGYADLVVGAPQYNSNIGRAYVYRGSATGLGSTPSVVTTGLGGMAQFGTAVAGAGDLNADGYPDVAIGEPFERTTGRAHVFFGSASGIAATADVVLTGVHTFGEALGGAGDVDGDGHADLAVGAWAYGGAVYLYLGGGTGVGPTPATTLLGEGGTTMNDLFGDAVTTAGDLNADGYADIVAGAPNAYAGTGRAYVFLGSAAGLTATPATTLIGTGGSFGEAVAGLGDVNGDGATDIAIGAYGLDTLRGAATVYTGSSGGLTTTPARTLPGLDGQFARMGVCIASM